MKGCKSRLPAFSILELLVATAVLSLLIVLLVSVLGQTSSATRRANESVSAFQSARSAFDLMTANLGQTVLAGYWDYQNSSGQFRTSGNRSGFQPAAYGRNSELHFLIQKAGLSPYPGTPGTGQIVAFQFPTDFSSSVKHAGMASLLSACGYFIEYGNREPLPSPFPQILDKYRYRLMQALQPSEDLSVYASSGSAWVAPLAAKAIPIADNVIYLAVWPRKSPAEDPTGAALTSNFTYDSRASSQTIPQPETANQAPPLLQVTIVCMDEASAVRICTGSTPPTQISNALTGLFQSSLQTDFDKDLGKLEERLAASRIGFRVFTAFVPILESKMQ